MALPSGIVGRTSTAFALLLLAAPVSASQRESERKLPSNHPDVVYSKFGGHLNCPYAKDWMSKGPEAAAQDLGVLPPGAGSRKLQGESVEGSCNFDSQWTGPTCIEFRGDSWTSESMSARCGQPGTEGTLTEGEGCTLPGQMAGWCVVAGGDGTEATTVALMNGMGCAAVGNACETFSGGTFVPTETCDGGAEGGDSGGSAPAAEFPSRCALAPGPIGGAHQDGYSDGYDFACPGVPGESSPWQWPLRWAANFEGGSILYGTDDVIYQNGGRVFYFLDKNWKRHDFYYQKGYQRSIVQGPCEQTIDEDGELRCIKNTNTSTTVLHKGNRMYFIEWADSYVARADGGYDANDVAECGYMDMKVIGNIRPDWFMDARGASTDVQYLGNQHIFYPTGAIENGAPVRPRLAKQWRKRDFADHYFTMSMQAHPGEDGVHWPLVLNVPGEGFGDDSIQHYFNHTLLVEGEGDGIFLIDEAYEALGGVCAEIARPGGDGPPALEEPFPSDLEVDENSWFSNEYTYSPVWIPPMKVDEGDCEHHTKSDEEGGMAVTQAGDSTTVASCFDAASGQVHLSVTFKDIGVADEESPIPWLALGFRDTEECLMTPRGGGDGEIILVRSSVDDPETLVAGHGPLPAAARRFDAGAFGSLESLVALDAAPGFSDAIATRGEDEVNLSFRMSTATLLSVPSSEAQPVLSKMMSEGGSDSGMKAPDVMHLSYAYGSSDTIGIHVARGCFKVIEFPKCPTEENGQGGADDSDSSENNDDSDGKGDGTNGKTGQEGDGQGNEGEISETKSASSTVVAVCSTSIIFASLVNFLMAA
uniref:Uncharacterized protein n=1 Tax=Pseudictyota dubia TaxID=2749911 RepID=A0A7R9WLG7_9STRA|mmetsp:Transcript_8729/g.16044  ORF Transcript_8729/g.16044 Transcript_8729/m.16044 type:complete len:816 (+) Transcript_8729:396-2843(+)